MEEENLALKYDLKCITRKHLAPYGLEEIELQHDRQRLNAAGALYVPLTEYKLPDPAMPSPLLVDTPEDKRSLPVKVRFENALKRERPEVMEGEKMNETLSEPEEDMDIGATPNEEIVPGNYSPGTTRKLLQDLRGEDWADTATPPLGSSRKNLEIQLGSKPANMGMVLLSSEGKEKNTFVGNKTKFLDAKFLDTIRRWNGM